MVDPLTHLRAIASDLTTTPGQLVDALAACASLPDFPVDRFVFVLRSGGWANVHLAREQATCACDSYADDHAYGAARRALEERTRNRDAALSAFWTERGVDARDGAAASSLVRHASGYGGNFTTAANGGLDCRLSRKVGWRYEPATLAELPHNTKPFGLACVATVGNLRRLSALGIVEHRDRRLYFTPAIVDALRAAGFIDADGREVKP